MQEWETAVIKSEMDFTGYDIMLHSPHYGPSEKWSGDLEGEYTAHYGKEDVLQQLAEKGWELVNVDHTKTASKISDTYHLKRPKEQTGHRDRPHNKVKGGNEMADIQLYFSLSLLDWSLLDNCFKYAEMSIEKKEIVCKQPLNNRDEYYLRRLRATRIKILDQLGESTSGVDEGLLASEAKKVEETTREFMDVMQDVEGAMYARFEELLKAATQ